MANSYFQFKQFRIDQDRCAMKVTTDACIQGAWTPVLPAVKRVLDIGSGTGLLSLMLAQRATGIILDAIEFDTQAATQTFENISSSPWRSRINAIECDVRGFVSAHKYDLIICNPPFFNNSLLGDKESRNIARHTLSLTHEELIKAISINMTDDGYCSILLPNAEYNHWCELANDALFHEVGRLSVSHSPDSPVKRVVSLFSKKAASVITENELAIKDADNSYTGAFIDLLSPFYLDL